MKKGHIILNIRPLNKNSLVLANFDELGFPHNTDFGSIRVVDDAYKSLRLYLIRRKDYSRKSRHSNDTNKNHLAVIIGRSNSKRIKILYNLSDKPRSYAGPPKNISILDDSGFAVNAGNVSILFEKKGYSIEKIKIKGHEYGPLQLAASGGSLFFQKDMKARFSIVCDSGIVKMIKISGIMKVEGSGCRKEGLLPVEIMYYFWSPDGRNVMAKAEIELKYDEATSLDAKKADFLDPLVWYRLDNYHGDLAANGLCTNGMGESKVITLKHPYYAGFKNGNSFFAMFPYLALPNDGIHVEKGKNFFGASWHSMSQPKKPYWADEKENTGKPQGFYPAHSLRGYWSIGLYFGDAGENIKDIASSFSYQPKIWNILHISPEPVSNACIARWKGNRKMAFNAITDDAKINDFLYRARGKIPKWVQMAIATRTMLGINYHRFCYMENKLFYLPKQKLLSTILSTLFCGIGFGTPLRKKFERENLSYLLHTNTHPRIYELGENGVKSQIEKAENIWVNKWKYKTPLSHVFSYASPYGIATENGTMEKAAFSASKSLQWIREWPIPNAPLDFFLPTRLFWGICSGEMFDKENCNRIKEEFAERYKNGCDYMLISGHVPEQTECPGYATEMFEFLQKHKDVWFAGSDDIIKYYKARESISISRAKKQGRKFLMELENKLPHYFSTEITLIQHIRKKINKIQFTLDNKKFVDVVYTFIGKKVVMYDVPSDAKRVVIS